MNFYVTAVNKQMKSEQDNPTIGLLICKDKDNVVAEYALDDISQPIGIAAYELTKVLREELKAVCRQWKKLNMNYLSKLAYRL